MNVGKVVGRGDLLLLAEAPAFPAPTHAHPRWPQECPKGPAWVLCDLSTDPCGEKGVLVPQQGGCGEIRNVAVELSHTKGFNHRDESSPLLNS